MFGQHNNDSDNDTQAPAHDSSQPTHTDDWQHPGTPLADTPVATPPTDTPTLSSHEDETETVAPTPEETHEEHAAPEPAAHTNDLLDIKQKALGELSPLVGHLDQSPEEKFKTTMMMIQASDDQSLIKTAYAAAQEITDEKTRAQALLDIINEINYFTHNKDEQ